MGKKIGSKSTSWYTYHQSHTEYYESQQAALVAVNLIISGYEKGIWERLDYYVYIGYEQEETVDRELFARHYSANVLTPASTARAFKIDIYDHNKEDWIFKCGSDLLQQSLRAGYDCNDGYLIERLAHDYPDFTINRWKYEKVNTPSERCLHACLGYQYSYCSINKEDNYITIDNYLGKYQLVKFIDPNLEITRVEFPIAVIDSAVEVPDYKQEWIFEHGSDLLQQSFMAGYECNNRYLQERIALDYPGFEINSGNYRKVDSPDERCLYACLGYEDAYCSSNDRDYYITIDNFLDKYQLIKPIDAPIEVTEAKSISATAISNLFSTKISRFNLPTSSAVIRFAAAGSTVLVGVLTILYLIYTVRLSV
jgi:hypothetical protein